MGNRPASYRPLPVESTKSSSHSSLPATMDICHSDAQSTSLEMELMQEVNGNNKWFKQYSRLDKNNKRYCLRRCKPVRVYWSILGLGIILAVLGIIYMYTRSSSTDSFATKQDIADMYRFINESCPHQQNHEDESCGCNSSLTLQLQDRVSKVQGQIDNMQSNVLAFGTQVSTVQRNLTDISEQIGMLQKSIENFTSKDNLFDSNLSNVHEHLSELTKKVSHLEAYAGNLSTTDHFHKIDQALAHGNISVTVAHVKSNVTTIAGVQANILDQITSLRQNISQLGIHFSTLQNSVQQQLSSAQNVASFSHRLDQVENSVTRLNTDIHSPLNLYERCKRDTASCTIDPDRRQRSDYWRECPTDYLPLDKEDWFTISYQCQYQSASRMNMEVLTPFVHNGRVRCDCDVTFPGNDSEHHRPVPRDISAVCKLVIVRCPLSQTLF